MTGYSTTNQSTVMLGNYVRDPIFYTEVPGRSSPDKAVSVQQDRKLSKFPHIGFHQPIPLPVPTESQRPDPLGRHKGGLTENRDACFATEPDAGAFTPLRTPPLFYEENTYI